MFNGGGGPLSLSGLSLPAGYTLAPSSVYSGGTMSVPSENSTTFVVQENASAIGTMGGTVTLTANDSVTLADSAGQ